MNIVNIMNFVRAVEPRREMDLYAPVRREIALNKKYGYDNTFLLQYDVCKDERFLEIFNREKDDKMELGLWLEMVRPLVEKVGLKWRGNPDWAWDWHVVPGFSPAYTQAERVLLIDEAFASFKDAFGYYPAAVGSWMIDSFSLEYMSQKYSVSAFAICRNQWAVDAYTLWGGYFNQGYYPSKLNELIVASDENLRIKTPVFRLLSPDPIYNYDTVKYRPCYLPEHPWDCFTMEPCWYMGRHERTVRWFFKTYFDNENLGFGYMQIGQENSFGEEEIFPGLEMQMRVLKEYVDSGRVEVKKLSDTGRWFDDTYAGITPPTSVVADDDWTGADTRSVYYDSQLYTANLFVRDGYAFIRSMHIFDEHCRSAYLEIPVSTPTAEVSTPPIMDTFNWDNDQVKSGIFLDGEVHGFSCVRDGGCLCVTLSCTGKDILIRFNECGIAVFGSALRFRMGISDIDFAVDEQGKITYNRGEFSYVIGYDGTAVKTLDGFDILPVGECVSIYCSLK